jgi:50S ribosomal protein L16 3-hydroxylase
MNQQSKPSPTRLSITRTARHQGSRAARADAALLGGLSVDEFLRIHWQRRPLLVRAALPDIKPPFDAQALIELAQNDSVQSRLVTSFGGRWQLAHGPFEPDQVPSLRRSRWTLLVQGVNLHDDRTHELMSKFRFIPDARLDDLMISLAANQGGVGPHLDSYDVFLIQLWGRRRWRIAPPGNDRLKPGLPLKILAQFEPTQEWLLEPGDMLYLPPGWAHDGIAEGPCMTGSVGFRAPSRQEFLREFLADAADSPGGPDPRFGDRGRSPTARAAEVPVDLHRQMQHWALNWRPTAVSVDDFIGRFLTEPAANVFFDAPLRLNEARFFEAGRRTGLQLDRRTRLLYRASCFHINGESVAAPKLRPARNLLQKLANLRQLTAHEASQASAHPELAQLLVDWARAGWLHPAISWKPR